MGPFRGSHNLGPPVENKILKLIISINHLSPPPSLFLPVTQNYHEAPILENSDLANLFVADAPMKKNQEI